MTTFPAMVRHTYPSTTYPILRNLTIGRRYLLIADEYAESLGHIRIIDDDGREQLCRTDCFEHESPADRLAEPGFLAIAFNLPSMDPALLTLDQLALVPARLVNDSLLFSGNRFFIHAMRMAKASTRKRLFDSVYQSHDASFLDQAHSELLLLDAEPPTTEHLQASLGLLSCVYAESSADEHQSLIASEWGALCCKASLSYAARLPARSPSSSTRL